MISDISMNSIFQAFDIEAECIRNMKDYIDKEQFSKAVELLIGAERIGAAGCGHSGIICQHFAHLMCCIEQPARFISPAEAVHGATGYLQKDDVMVLHQEGVKLKNFYLFLIYARKKALKL